MTTTTDHAAASAAPEGDQSFLRKDSARRAIAMAVVLCAGIAGGILLSNGYDDRLDSYGDHAASYLAEDADLVTSEQMAVADTAPATTVSVGAAEPICKEYTKDVLIGGQMETIHGTACRQSDGTWDIVQ